MFRPGDKVGVYPVVNADQTVIIIWDAATKTQHFIRRASFKSEGDNFGFIIPSPQQPTLAEAGNDAFPYLFKLTEPETIKRRASSGMNCSCGKGDSKSAVDFGSKAAPEVRVLEEKVLAGFKAAVLEATSANALVKWLKDNDYAYSPEIEAWAKPYIPAWKFTALKVVKPTDAREQDRVSASALRLSFKTDRPLFPYREPDYKGATQTLHAQQRLLRIYFLAEARYKGGFPSEAGWSGRAVWADKLSDLDRKQVLELLQLPPDTGPAEWFLTEFEDDWPYRVAPADVYFSRDADQGTFKRPPIIQYVAAPWPTDAAVYAIAAAMVVPLLLRRVRRRKE
jgi:hypothetical protein